MTYIMTITARQKNAKRHIFARSCNLDGLRKSAAHINTKYRVEIYTGDWKLLEVVRA